MKKHIILSIVGFLAMTISFAQEIEFMQITTIESVVPMGLGRSRMVAITPDGTMEEIKMKNFFSAVGINFGNVRQNDQMITDKIEELYKKGWEIVTITPGVYSAEGSNGIFITRYLFKKEKKEESAE